MIYRINYLKDTALATGIEESIQQSLSNIITSHNIEIIQAIVISPTNMNVLYEKLKSESLNVRADAISFLTEIFQMSKGF